MLLFALDILTTVDLLSLTVAMFVIVPFIKGLASALGNALAQYLRERWKNRRNRYEESSECNQPGKDDQISSSHPLK
jgi:hypothetical protein